MTFLMRTTDSISMSQRAINLIDMHFQKPGKDEHFTHVTTSKPKQRLSISRSNWDMFFTKYEKRIQHPTFNCSIAERNIEYSQLVVDIDRTECGAEPTELYTMEEVHAVVNNYQQVIQDIVLDVKTSHLTAVILTKAPYMKTDNIISHGYHIQFPHLFLNRQCREIIRTRVSTMMENKVDIDNVDNKCWLLYGSRKKKTTGSYTATCCIRSTGTIQSVESFLSSYVLYDENEKPFTPTMVNLPRVLSIIPFNRYVYYEYNYGMNQEGVKQPKSPISYPKLSDDKELETCKLLINSIKSERSDDYNEWFAIGSALHTTLEGSQEGLNLFLEFSQRCEEKYNETECRNVWGKMRESGYTKGTLIHYFNEDKPKLPNRIRMIK